MEERVELADGTVVQNAYVVRLTETSINIYVNGEHTFTEMADWFTVKKRTKKITAHRHGGVDVWTGFTTVSIIQVKDEFAYVCLSQP